MSEGNAKSNKPERQLPILHPRASVRAHGPSGGTAATPQTYGGDKFGDKGSLAQILVPRLMMLELSGVIRANRFA